MYRKFSEIATVVFRDMRADRQTNRQTDTLITILCTPTSQKGGKKEAFWLDRLSQQGHSSSLTWQSLSTLLGRDRNVTGATGHTADGFAAFFARKVDDVMAATTGQPPPPVVNTAHCSLPSFRPCSPADLLHHKPRVLGRPLG